MNKVGDIAILITKGTTPTTIGEGFTESGVNFVKVESIDNNGNIIPDFLQKISEQTHKKLKRSQLKENDLLITIAGALGRTYVVRKEILPANTNQAVGIIRVDSKKYSPYFLKYWLQTNWVQKTLGLANAQSIQNNLNLVNLGDIDIPDLVLTKQLDVVKLLSLFDKKIELNNKINVELEQMAKILYDYWFVQFDFPDADGKPYKSSGGAMVYNEELKREIPRDWKVKKLDDIISKSGTGLNPRDNFELGHGDNFYITIKNVKGGKIIFDDACDRVDDEALKIINKRSDLQIGDILFTSIEPVGVTYFIHEKPTNWNINESVFTIRADYEKVTAEYLYMLLSGAEMKAFTRNASAGSIHKGIRHNVLKTFKLPYKDKVKTEEFSKIVNPFLKRIYMLDNESQKLAELRDWLLPMLMNGQVKVN